MLFLLLDSPDGLDPNELAPHQLVFVFPQSSPIIAVLKIERWPPNVPLRRNCFVAYCFLCFVAPDETLKIFKNSGNISLESHFC